METLIEVGNETVETRTICHKKEFKWQIDHFEDWWSSRELAESERMGSDELTEEEELQDEIPKDWSKSTPSPIMKFEVEGIQHEFMLSILKYDSYDRFDKDHNEMMGISLFYNGPSKFIIVKPTFSINENETEVHNPLQAKILKKQTYSEYRTYSSHNLLANKDLVFPENQLNIRCSVQINVFKEFPNVRSLEKNVLSKRTWNQCLLEEFDFNSSTSDWDKFSDFKIICQEINESGDTHEKTFRCHKLVLSLGSKYYRRMFSGNYREIEGSAKVTDISCDTMTNLLQYIYSGDVKKSNIDVDLLLAADKYEIEHLKAVCELELGHNISIENASQLSVIANMCGSQVFKNHVYSFVREQWTKISELKDSEILQKQPEILWEILNRSATG